MRRAAVVLTALVLSAFAPPARAQDVLPGGPPCWGLCQLWPGGGDETAVSMRRATRHRFRRHRWGRWALRDRSPVVEEREFDEPGSRPSRVRRHGRPSAPVVAVAKPAPVPVAQPSAVTPAVAGPPTAQPKIEPATARVTAPKAPAAPAAAVTAAPLE